MAVRKKGLGKGLDSMFPVYDVVKKEPDSSETDHSEEQSAVNTGKSKKSTSSGKKKTAAKSTKSSSSKSKKKTVQVKTAIEDVSSDSVLNADTNTAFSDTDIDPSVSNDPETEVNHAETEKVPENGIITVKLSEVEPNREQPRKEFDRESLEELAGSIKQYGVIQPLIVQKREGYYEIIAGERRWRASKLAGIKEIPVIIKEYTDREVMEVSLIENIQREDLNPIEEAEAYRRLIEEYDLRQDELAEKVSKSRTTITNALRLLKLDPRVREMVIAGELATGHARALLALTDIHQQYEAAQLTIEKKLSVREVEKLVKKILQDNENESGGNESQTGAAANSSAIQLIYTEMENQLKSLLGTKVSVHQKDAQKGRIEISYYSVEEFERIYDLLRSIRQEL